jgi:hypothetical protein
MLRTEGKGYAGGRCLVRGGVCGRRTPMAPFVLTLGLLDHAEPRIERLVARFTCPVHPLVDTAHGLACSMCVLDSIILTLARDRKPARRTSSLIRQNADHCQSAHEKA